MATDGERLMIRQRRLAARSAAYAGGHEAATSASSSGSRAGGLLGTGPAGTVGLSGGLSGGQGRRARELAGQAVVLAVFCLLAAAIAAAAVMLGGLP